MSVQRFLLLVVAGLLVGCGGDSSGLLSPNEKLTLYSIDPLSIIRKEGSPPPDGETFHKYVVLGKLDVTDSGTRKEIVRALNEGVAAKPEPAKCFEPRHGIRAMKGNVVRDFVICFECYQLAIHEGEMTKIVTTSRGPLPVFNKALKDAGIKIAPVVFKSKEDE